VTQPVTQTQTAPYWGADFELTDSDIEHIYNYFLEKEQPQTTADIVRSVMAHRIAEEVNAVKKQLSGRSVYQPGNTYKVGDALVFPMLKFASGKVTAVRDGYNPQDGQFKAITVDINGTPREFASQLTTDHILNATSSEDLTEQADSDIDTVYAQYGAGIAAKIEKSLTKNPEFIHLDHLWFVKSLMAEINVGHFHLTEAVLEMYEGGPLKTEEILPHLDMDASADASVQAFSLNHQLLQDERFDQIAPAGEFSWFLKRMEPQELQNPPARLQYNSIPYDRALLSPQLLLLERELDDEWSDLEASSIPYPTVFTLIYPHRLVGVIPLTSRIRPLFPAGNMPRQRVVLVDDETEEEVVGWVSFNGRFVWGLKEWYEKHTIPVGGFIHLKPGPKPGIVSLGFDRRRGQKEWVRLATAVDNRIQFELKRRSVGCGFDDLMIVGTDTIAAIDALWKRAETNQRSVASLLAEIFPPLADLNPQGTVHAKTLYSAINMLKRVTPGAMFAELVRHPAFQPVGDHYWKFVQNRWQDGH
jgi:hypothetical protein